MLKKGQAESAPGGGCIPVHRQAGCRLGPTRTCQSSSIAVPFITIMQPCQHLLGLSACATALAASLVAALGAPHCSTSRPSCAHASPSGCAASSPPAPASAPAPACCWCCCRWALQILLGAACPPPACWGGICCSLQGVGDLITCDSLVSVGGHYGSAAASTTKPRGIRAHGTEPRCCRA